MRDNNPPPHQPPEPRRDRIADALAIAARVRHALGDTTPAALAARLRMGERAAARRLEEPTLPFLVAFCAVYGVRPDWLLMGDDGQPFATAPTYAACVMCGGVMEPGPYPFCCDNCADDAALAATRG